LTVEGPAMTFPRTAMLPTELAVAGLDRRTEGRA
jgi:hypothetical protein